MMRCFKSILAALGLLSLPVYGDTNQTLRPWALKPLPLGSIKPLGWLQDQMTLMANGLAGHEAEFYSFVVGSPWLGGTTEYSALYESWPYWVNGLVPLAYGLDDQRLKDQVTSSIDIVLKNQSADGWIGPESGTARNLWARYPAILAMTQLAEADPAWAPRIVDALYKFNALLNVNLKNNFTTYIWHDGDIFPADSDQWGRVRFSNLLLSLQWLDEHYPRTQVEKTQIWENMALLVQGSLNWGAWFSDGTFIKEDLNMIDVSVTAPVFPFTHGVNLGEGLKALGVINRFTPDDSLPAAARHAVNETFTYHTAASGVILGDERIDGLAPYYGSELCTVVEMMFSLTKLHQIYGDGYFAEMAELNAFNALPTMLTPDHWAHQYVAQPNQPFSHHLVDPATGQESDPFWNTNPWSQTFGLEPNYPCCTVNHPQGYPKLLSAAFAAMQSANGTTVGAVHSLLVPAIANITLGNNETMQVECETNYPFNNQLKYSIDSPKQTTLHIRVPSWADGANTTLEHSVGPTIVPEVDNTTGLVAVDIPPGKTTLQYNIGGWDTIRQVPRANDTISIYVGALLFAIDIPSTNTTTAPKSFSDVNTPVAGAPPQAVDYQFENATAWNIAVDPNTLKVVVDKAVAAASALPNPIWASGAPPIHLEGKGCLIENWGLYKAVPDVPPTGSARQCVGDAIAVKLVPYGSARTRIADIPTSPIDLTKTEVTT